MQEYLKSLPEDRRTAVNTVREVVLKNLPKGYEEVMNWGMITWQVPLDVYPDTYNKQPLMYAALASQKNHMSVYLTGINMDEEIRRTFEADYRATGKRYDAGRSCIRFRKLEDIPLELIGKAVAAFPVEEFIGRVKSLRPVRKKASGK